jgi:hypothetical protein
LVVNEKVNVKKEYHKQARAMCWNLITEGAAFERAGNDIVPVDRKKLGGMLAFIYHIKQWDINRRIQQWDAERQKRYIKETEKRGFNRVYADFLNYVSFFGQEQPTIVCEGKTDNVYRNCPGRC